MLYVCIVLLVMVLRILSARIVCVGNGGFVCLRVFVGMDVRLWGLGVIVKELIIARLRSVCALLINFNVFLGSVGTVSMVRLSVRRIKTKKTTVGMIKFWGISKSMSELEFHKYKELVLEPLLVNPSKRMISFVSIVGNIWIRVLITSEKQW